LSDEVTSAPTPGLAALIRAFGLIGLTSFGGATMTYFFQEIVGRRHYLSHEEMMDQLAISELLPGANPADLAVLVGRRLGGLRGAIAALTAMILPGAILMLVLGVIYFHGGQLSLITPFFKGLGPAAAGLALANALQASGREVRSLRSVWLLPVTVAVVLLLRPATLIVIVVLGAVGVFLFRPRGTPSAPTESSGSPS
jgi:chromate transporter